MSTFEYFNATVLVRIYFRNTPRGQFTKREIESKTVPNVRAECIIKTLISRRVQAILFVPLYLVGCAMRAEYSFPTSTFAVNRSIYWRWFSGGVLVVLQIPQVGLRQGWLFAMLGLNDQNCIRIKMNTRITFYLVTEKDKKIEIHLD